MPNKRTDELPPCSDPKPDMQLPIWNHLTARTERLRLGDIMPTEGSTQNFEWVPDKDPAYQTGESVTYGGYWYISLINDNESVPGTNELHWQLLNKSSSGTFWKAGLYTDEFPFVYSHHNGVLEIYELVDPARPYNSTNLITEIAAGDWALVGAEQHFRGKFTSLVNLQTAIPTGEDGDYAIVNPGLGDPAIEYIWDLGDGWVESGGGESFSFGNGLTNNDGEITLGGDLDDFVYFTTGPFKIAVNGELQVSGLLNGDLDFNMNGEAIISGSLDVVTSEDGLNSYAFSIGSGSSMNLGYSDMGEEYTIAGSLQNSSGVTSIGYYNDHPGQEANTIFTIGGDITIGLGPNHVMAYLADYTPYFTALSLVHKGYVDDLFSTVGGDFWELEGESIITDNININPEADNTLDITFGRPLGHVDGDLRFAEFNVYAGDYIRLAQDFSSIELQAFAARIKWASGSKTAYFEASSAGSFWQWNNPDTSKNVQIQIIDDGLSLSSSSGAVFAYADDPTIYLTNPLHIPHRGYVDAGDDLNRTLTANTEIQGDVNFELDFKKLTFKNRTGTNQIQINSAGEIDTAFATGAGAEGGDIRVLKKLASGKIIIGGTFTTYDGNASSRIARLNSDGSYDSTFVVGTGFNNTVAGIVEQTDGKLVVVGSFTSYNGTSKNRILRLNTDGTVDGTYTTGTGFSTGTDFSIDIQTDDKVIVGGGSNWNYNGTSGLGRIIRLNTDGTRDTSFATGTGFNSTVRVKVLPDGNVLCYGSFTTFKGVSQVRVARVTTLGALDATLVIGTSFDGEVTKFLRQSDGNYIFFGDFTTYNGNTANRIARISSTGTFDSTYGGTGFDSSITHAIINSADKVVIYGTFTTYNGTSVGRAVYLTTAGALDTSISFSLFGSTTVDTGYVDSTTGKYTIGGTFTTYDGTARGKIARNSVNGYSKVTGNLLIADDADGVILQSPDGHYWKLAVSNAGTLSATDIGTSL